MKGSRLPIRINLKPNLTVKQFMKELNRGGYTAKRLAEAIDIYQLMLDDKNCIKFLSIAGALIAGGLRNVLTKFIREKKVDVLLSTGAILTHDLIEAFGIHHYPGSLNIDDRELAKEKNFRMYDVFLKQEGFSKLEDNLKLILPNLPQKEMSSREFLKELGKHIKDENSIIKACYDMNVDIYCPSITDSMLGFQLWMYQQNNPLKINTQLDIQDFMDIVWQKDKTYGMLILGGGVPKHFVPGMMQASGNSLKYTIQITMDRPEHGGVSGMQIIEAKSWGKISPDGITTDVRCDVTLAFPLIVASLISDK